MKNDVLIKKLALAENPFLYYYENKLLVKNKFINEIEGISIEILDNFFDKIVRNSSNLLQESNNRTLTFESVFYYKKAFKLIKEIWPQYYIEIRGTTKFLTIVPQAGLQVVMNLSMPKIIFMPHITNDFMKVAEVIIYQSSFLRLQHLIIQDELIVNDINEKVFSVNHCEPVSIQKVFFETFAAMRLASWLERLYEIYPTGENFHKLDLVSYELSTNINLLKRNAEYTPIGRELWLELIENIYLFFNRRKESRCVGEMRI